MVILLLINSFMVRSNINKNEKIFGLSSLLNNLIYKMIKIGIITFI